LQFSYLLYKQKTLHLATNGGMAPGPSLDPPLHRRFASAQLHANIHEFACKYLTTRQFTSLPFLREVACFDKPVYKVFDATSNLLATLLGSSGWEAVEPTGRTVKHQHTQFIRRDNVARFTVSNQWRHYGRGGGTARVETLQGVTPKEKKIVGKFTKNSGQRRSDR